MMDIFKILASIPICCGFSARQPNDIPLATSRVLSRRARSLWQLIVYRLDPLHTKDSLRPGEHDKYSIATPMATYFRLSATGTNYNLCWQRRYTFDVTMFVRRPLQQLWNGTTYQGRRNSHRPFNNKSPCASFDLPRGNAAGPLSNHSVVVEVVNSVAPLLNQRSSNLYSKDAQV